MLNPEEIKALDLVLRPMNKLDENFILNSWLQSARKHPEFINISNQVYYKEYAKFIQKVIKNGCTVLCNLQDPNSIYGYIVADQDNKLVHFIYIKYSFRKFGFAKKLFELIQPDFEATFYSKKNKHSYNPFKRYI